MPEQITVTLPYEHGPDPITCTELQKAIGQKPVRMENRQHYGLYNHGCSFTYAWSAVYPKEKEAVVKYIYLPNQCRETSCNPIALREASPGCIHNMVEHANKKTGSYLRRRIDYREYINNGSPTIFILQTDKMDNIKSGLRILHHYERLARAGKTKVYPVSHKMYNASRAYYHRDPAKAGPFTITESKHKLVLVVAPAYWHFSIPMASIFTLLLRVIAYMKMGKTESVPVYMERVLSSTGLYSNDRLFLEAVYKYMFMGTKLDMISVQCRRWRVLSRTVKAHTDTYCGHWGSKQVSDNITAWQDAVAKNERMKLGTQEHLKPQNYFVRTSIPPYKSYVPALVHQLKREHRRVTRANNKKRSSETS